MGIFDPPKTTTNQTTTTSPYPLAKPLLNTGLTDALNLYKSHRLNPFTPLSRTTTNGLAGLTSQAISNRAPLQQSLQRFRNMAGGSGDVSSSGQLDIAHRALGPSMTEQNLSGIAHGDLIGQGDPTYDRLRQRALEDASTEASMQASGMGRTGSDYHQAAVGTRVADTVGSMDYQRMQDERARQVEANSLIDQLRQSGMGIGLNAQNSATAVQTGNQDRRFNANAAIPGAADATLSPYASILGAGSTLDANNAAKAGTGGANLSSLMQLLGLASSYGTTSGSGQTVEPSNKAGILAGGGLGLASLLFG